MLAGGQSLLPALNMRLLRPALLVDVNRVPGLDDVVGEDGALRIGATVRQADHEAASRTSGAGGRPPPCRAHGHPESRHGLRIDRTCGCRRRASARARRLRRLGGRRLRRAVAARSLPTTCSSAPTRRRSRPTSSWSRRSGRSCRRRRIRLRRGRAARRRLRALHGRRPHPRRRPPRRRRLRHSRPRPCSRSTRSARASRRRHRSSHGARSTHRPSTSATSCTCSSIGSSSARRERAA